MRRIIPAALFLAACHAGTTPKPDPTGSGGATSASASTTNAATSSAAGTGGSSSKAAEYTGGSRLKVRTLTADDGSAQQLGFHDSQMQTDCTFTVAGDGATRCIPAAYVGVGYPPLTFADANCTQPIGLTPTCAGQQPTFANGYEVASCMVYRIHIYPITGALMSGTIYSDATGPCAAAAVPAGYSGWTVGPEIPPSTFVAATESVQP